MKELHFNQKPETQTEEEFLQYVREGVQERLESATGVVRVGEYYYNEAGDDFLDRDKPPVGSYKLVIVFRTTSDIHAAYHQPVRDMLLATLGVAEVLPESEGAEE